MSDLRVVEMVPELSFSSQEGFEPENFNYTCPTTGMHCMEKLKLISMYTRDIDEAAVERGDATDDIWKLNIKLGEYSVWAATGIDCVAADGCVIRKAMNESTARQTAVKSVRGLRKLLS